MKLKIACAVRISILHTTGADAGWLPWLPGQPPFCFEKSNMVK